MESYLQRARDSPWPVEAAQEGLEVAGHIYRKTEVVGTSQSVISDAIQAAVARASQTLKGLDWFEVKEIRGTIKDGKVDEYQVTVSIGFRLMSEDELKA
jgi:flavin-binding protein dodecin